MREGWTKGFERCEVMECEASSLPLIPGGPLLHHVVVYLHKHGFVMYDVDEVIRPSSDGAVWRLDESICRMDCPLRTARILRRAPDGPSGGMV